MTSYVLLVLVVLGINLMPALGPPTWAVLVLFRLHQHLALVPLVLLGAASATVGRVLLALGTAWAARWLPAQRVENLRAAGELLRRRRSQAVLGLGLFLLSPLPSAQLFEAAGVMRLNLRPIAAAFFVGRLVSYSLYAGAATAADKSLGGALQDSLTSWPSIALQVLLIVGVVLLSRVDWAKRLSH
jgi:membrane protein YqaA with SNARE-associated domain